MDEKLAGALAGAGASLLVAILGQIFNPLAQKRLERHKSELQASLEVHKTELQSSLEGQRSLWQNSLERQKAESTMEIEALKAALADRNSVQASRRDYEYEARKRLYTDIEPTFFQLYEAVEECYSRIRSLARSARQGVLGPDPSSWTGHEGYYLVSTCFKLISPCVAFRQVQRRLTFVDLTLDPLIRLRYLLTKNIVHSFKGHFDFAALDPVLVYTPAHSKESSAPEHRPTQRFQGIVSGDLDNIIDELLVKDGDALRPITLGEFGQRLQQRGKDSPLGTLVALYLGFSPETDPVLARMLLAQAGLCHLLMSTFKGAESLTDLRVGLDEFSRSDEVHTGLSWKDRDLQGSAFHTVKPYISMCLDWIESAP